MTRLRLKPEPGSRDKRYITVYEVFGANDLGDTMRISLVVDAEAALGAKALRPVPDGQRRLDG